MLRAGGGIRKSQDELGLHSGGIYSAQLCGWSREGRDDTEILQRSKKILHVLKIKHGILNYV